jgi:hypothetical protein
MLPARVTVCKWKPWVGSAPRLEPSSRTSPLVAWARRLASSGVGVTLGSGRAALGQSLAYRGDLETASREVAESEVEVEFGIGRRRGMLLVGEPPGVERCIVDCACGASKEELVARSVDADEERELLESLEYETAGTLIGIHGLGWPWIDRGRVKSQGLPAGRDMLRRGAGEAPCGDGTHGRHLSIRCENVAHTDVLFSR